MINFSPLHPDRSILEMHWDQTDMLNIPGTGSIGSSPSVPATTTLLYILEYYRDFETDMDSYSMKLFVSLRGRDTWEVKPRAP